METLSEDIIIKNFRFFKNSSEQNIKNINDIVYDCHESKISRNCRRKLLLLLLLDEKNKNAEKNI